MSHIWVLVSGFLFANFMCLIAIWNTYSFNSLEPKYIGASFNNNKSEEMDSLLLKSVQKYIKKYFNIKTSLEENVKIDLNSNSTFFLGESLDNFTETKSLKDKLNNYQNPKISDNSKFSLFLDREKKNIMILKISNEDNKLNKYDSKNGEIILYTIPVDNFISNNINKLNKNNDINQFNKENNTNNKRQFMLNLNFTQKKNYLENSLIKVCWNSKFLGRIIGAVASADKRKLSIFYSVIKGPTVTYRIRYFHDIYCNNDLIKKSDSIMIENFNHYLDGRNELNEMKKKTNNLIENYFEITDELSKKNIEREKSENKKWKKDENNQKDQRRYRKERINFEKEKIFKNYFDDETYDDFFLKGNTPITAMAIKDNVIAYARDLDFRQYYILKREKKLLKNINSETLYTNTNLISPSKLQESKLEENHNEETEKEKIKDIKITSIESNKNTESKNNLNIENQNYLNTATIWKVSSLGPKIDRKIQPFFHTNSLKFIDDPINDYRLIHIFVSLNSTDISCHGNFRISNHTDFNENFTELTFTSVPFFKVLLINELLEGNEEFNLEKSVKKLKNYLKPTLFSNNFNSQEMIFEFTKSYLLLMHSNITTGNVNFIRMRPDIKEKISKIHSDTDNENILITYEGKKEMVYLLKQKNYDAENIDDPNSFTEYSKSISLKNLPKYYRNKETVNYLIEKIQDKYIMIILNEDGNILGLDMTDVRNKIVGKGWLSFFSNFNWSTTLILIFNIGTVLIYYHYSNMRMIQMGNIARRRQTEINSIIQEIIRLNNLNLAYTNNLVNQNAQIENQNINQNNNLLESNNIEVQDSSNNNENNHRNQNDLNIENENIEPRNDTNQYNSNINQNDIINIETQLNNVINNENPSRNDYQDNNARDENINENDIEENQNLLQNSNEMDHSHDSSNLVQNQEDVLIGGNLINERTFQFDLNQNLNNILSQLNSQIYTSINISDLRRNIDREEATDIINSYENTNNSSLENETNHNNEDYLNNNIGNQYHFVNLENNINLDFNPNTNIQVENQTNFEIDRQINQDENEITYETELIQDKIDKSEFVKNVENIQNINESKSKGEESLNLNDYSLKNISVKDKIKE